jgi:hypothetical protein
MNHILNIDVDSNRYIYYLEDEVNEFYFSYWQLLKLIHDHFILSIFVIKLKKMSSTTDDTFDDELRWVREVSKKSEFFPNYIFDNLELGKTGKFLTRNSIF